MHTFTQPPPLILFQCLSHMSYLMQCLPCVKFGRLVIGAPVAVRMYKFPSEHLESGRRSPKLHSHTAPPSSSNSLQHQSSTDTTQRGIHVAFLPIESITILTVVAKLMMKKLRTQRVLPAGQVSDHWSEVVAGGHFVQRGVGICLFLIIFLKIILMMTILVCAA